MKAEACGGEGRPAGAAVQVRTLRTAGLEAAERGERRNLRLARIVVARWHGRTMLMCFKAWREEMVAARGRVAEAAAEALRSRLAMVALLRWRLRDVHFAFAQWRRRASQRKSEAKRPLTPAVAPEEAGARRRRRKSAGAPLAAAPEPLPAAAPTASPRSPRRPAPPGPTSPLGRLDDDELARRRARRGDGGRAPRSRGRPLVRRARHARRAAARTV